MNRLIMGLCVVVCFSACRNNKEYKTYLHNPELFSQAAHELNSVVMGNNFNPMIASRNYAYAAIAAYEVIAAGISERYTITRRAVEWAQNHIVPHRIKWLT
jgi:hypothetical protein